HLYAFLFGRVDDRLLLPANQVVEEREGDHCCYCPQSSSSSSAGRTETIPVSLSLRISYEAPQSLQDTTSPWMASAGITSGASHSGQFMGSPANFSVSMAHVI